MHAIQDLSYGADFDYVEGSPHLKHQHLYRMLVNELRQTMSDVQARGLPCALLDVGAGDGSFVEPALAAGWQVTALEMSSASVAKLQSNYGRNSDFEAVLDDGTFGVISDRKFSIIVFGSVLHHIPDYMGALKLVSGSNLVVGGSILSFQDPIWYEHQGRKTRFASELAYASWRMGRGNVMTGFGNRIRRRRGNFDVNKPADMVEYHVVRDGVNQAQILRFAQGKFEYASILEYWSTQSSFWQRVGEQIGLSNTFMLLAHGYVGIS